MTAPIAWCTTYDYDAQATYVYCLPGHSAQTIEVGHGINVDLDAEGHVVGFELLFLPPSVVASAHPPPDGYPRLQADVTWRSPS